MCVCVALFIITKLAIRKLACLLQRNTRKNVRNLCCTFRRVGVVTFTVACVVLCLMGSVELLLSEHFPAP